MIPSLCPVGAAPGEQVVFRGLAAAPNTEDWVVLHSLWLANHVRQVEGEADFVVIVPGSGVLVIEVKSHQSLEILRNGDWKLGNQKPTSRSPFQQATDARHSIKNYLDRKIDTRSIPIVSCVWFSRLRARTMLSESLSWHPWQVLDSDDVTRDFRSTILRTLTAGTNHLDDKIKHFSYGGVGPDQHTADGIVRLLRPRVEVYAAPGDLRNARKNQLIGFIEEQYRALDAMSDNKQVLFTGPAGAGKTLLAIEATQREVAQGKRGRLLCFNRLLGRELARSFSEVPEATVGTFHQELLRITGLTPEQNAPSSFWEEELPERAIDALIVGGHEKISQFLIIDEIQDISRNIYLDVLDLMVDGGLKDGRILFFGDFERQAIYEPLERRQLLRERTTGLVISKLTVNCRNLPRIGTIVNKFSKLEPGYGTFRRDDDGVDPTFIGYRHEGDQSNELKTAVQSLRSEGFDLNEIVVLSPLRGKSTAATTTDTWLRQLLVEAGSGSVRKGQLRYSTIHAFKGLEAAAIIITDLDRSNMPSFESILYVGLTRATDRLVVLIEGNTFRGIVGG